MKGLLTWISWRPCRWFAAPPPWPGGSPPGRSATPAHSTQPYIFWSRNQHPPHVSIQERCYLLPFQFVKLLTPPVKLSVLPFNHLLRFVLPLFSFIFLYLPFLSNFYPVSLSHWYNSPSMTQCGKHTVHSFLLVFRSTGEILIITRFPLRWNSPIFPQRESISWQICFTTQQPEQICLRKSNVSCTTDGVFLEWRGMHNRRGVDYSDFRSLNTQNPLIWLYKKVGST